MLDIQIPTIISIFKSQSRASLLSERMSDVYVPPPPEVPYHEQVQPIGRRRADPAEFAHGEVPHAQCHVHPVPGDAAVVIDDAAAPFVEVPDARYCDMLATVGQQSLLAYEKEWHAKQAELANARIKKNKPLSPGQLEKERRAKNSLARLHDAMTLPACQWGYKKPPQPYPKPKPNVPADSDHESGPASDNDKENAVPPLRFEGDFDIDSEFQDEIPDIRVHRARKRRKKRKSEKEFCCERGCSALYDPCKVLQIRLQTQFLPKGNLRHWVQQRTVCVKEPIGVCADDANHDKKHCTYRLEQPCVLGAQSICQKKACCITDTNSQQVCLGFLAFCIDRSTNYVYQPTKRFSRVPGQQITEKDPTFTRTAVKQLGVAEWLREQRDYWLHDPKSKDVILPTQALFDTYLWYRKETQEKGLEKPSEYTTFQRAFQTVSGEGIKLRHRRWLLFMKCDACTTLRQRIYDSHDKQEKGYLRKQHHDHLTEVMACRDGYYMRRRLATRKPEKYTSIIIDGADQKNYALPYKYEKSHVLAGAQKTKVGLMGVLVHGIGMYAYTYFPNCEAGSNATIDTLHRTLMKILKEKGKLGQTLFLQLDNTCRQNKSQYVKVYLGHLVEAGIFAKIVVSYLPVGHTHEDIDQCFGRLSIYLRKHDALDLPGLLHCIKHSQNVGTKMQPQVEHLTNFANVSDYLLPYYVHSRWEGISKYYQFKFQISSDEDPQFHGKAIVMARSDAWGHKPWAGLEERSIKSVVFGKPKAVMPRELVPSLLPSAKRAKLLPPALQKDARNGIAKIANAYHFSEELQSRLHSYVDQLCLPLHTVLKCTWNTSDVKALYAYGRTQQILTSHDEDDALEDEDEDIKKAAAPKGIIPMVGKWYVFNPVDGVNFDTEPYQLGMIRGFTKKVYDDGKTYDSAWVQWWVAQKDEFYTGQHKPTIVLDNKVTMTNLDNVFFEAIEQEVVPLYTAEEHALVRKEKMTQKDQKAGKGYKLGIQRGAKCHQKKGMWVPPDGQETLRFWNARHSDRSGDAAQLTDGEDD